MRPETPRLPTWFRGWVRRLKCQSATLYVPDPLAPRAFHLALRTRLMVPEVMSGLVLPRASEERLVGRRDGEVDGFTWFVDAPAHPSLQDPPGDPLASLREKNPIWGGFVKREGVLSSARLRLPQNPWEGPVLWVNYGREFRPTSAPESELRAFFAECLRRMPKIVAAIPPVSAAEVLPVLHAMRALTHDEPDLKEHWRALLEALVAILGVQHASLWTFDRRTLTLHRAAHSPPTGDDDRELLCAREGEGVVSWVALQERPVLIEYMRLSPFITAGVYRPTIPGIRYELAVPLIADDELLGVLNFESTTVVSPFTPGRVRAVQYAAMNAALFTRLHQQREDSRRLVELTRDTAASGPADAAQLIGGFALKACARAGAHYCAVWRKSRGRFELVGQSEARALVPDPSTGGWTEWIDAQRHPIWIDRIRSTKDFRAQVFRENRWWTMSAAGYTDVPTMLSHMGTPDGTVAELGLPLYVGTHSLGVAWLKFSHTGEETPTPRALRAASDFAAEVSVLLTVKHVHEHGDSRAVLDLLAGVRSKHFVEEPFVSDRLATYACYEPCRGGVGEDFYALHQRGPDTVMGVIGDATGDGTKGALGMLPLLWTFLDASATTDSTKHVLERLRECCLRLGVGGTALCFLIDWREPGKLRLFASSAGHPPLVIASHGVDPVEFPGTDGNAMLLYLPCIPYTEHMVELAPGSLILAFTDGISDATLVSSDVQIKFGVPGVRKSLYDALGRRLDLKSIARAILSEAHAHQSGAALTDDATVLALEIREPEVR